MRLFLSGTDKEKAIQVKDYAVNRGTKHGVTPAIIIAVLGQVKQGLEDPNPDWLSTVAPDQKKKVNKVWSSVTAEWQTHSSNRATYDAAELQRVADAKAAREAEAAAKEADKKDSIKLMTLASKESEKEVSKALSNVDATVKSFLGEKLMISSKSGRIVVKKDQVLSKADFAEVLASFDTFDTYTEAVRSEASAREAQVAVLAKKKLGDSWRTLYAERPRALARVAKYTKVYETLDELQKPVFGTVSNMRKAMEVKVDLPTDTPEQATAKNKVAKSTIIDRVIALQTKEKRNATQAEITEIVKKVKSESGVKVDLKFACIYIIPDENGKMFTVGGALKDQRLTAVMAFAITSKMTKIIMKEGVPIEVPIKAPSDKRNEWIDKLIAEMSGETEAEPEPVVAGTNLKKGKKASVTETVKVKKEELKKEESEEEETEEEETEEEEELELEDEEGETEEGETEEGEAEEGEAEEESEEEGESEEEEEEAGEEEEE